ncbi:thioesterase [Nostoc sp. C057]|uniref:thioesterase II family protein n=1 Tax=Nostoc sp. C057 TaxID=2576903 RepID=UPI0015C39FBF|nr:thioesterase [Nostoc sp. C057]QLE49257.1 thioesterase [Nostoc sp. C057]
MTATKELNTWIFSPKLNTKAKLRFFCFPYAGGGTSLFRDWVNGLPSDVEVCQVLLPGHDTRIKEKPFSHLITLIETMVPSLLPYLDMPFVFYGHSMGALLCFEAARRLRKQHNLEPKHLFVSGSRAPQTPCFLKPTHHLPDNLFIDEINKRYKAIPKEILNNQEIMQLFLPVLKADFSIIETYEYTPDLPLNCSISAFGGLQDEMVNIEDIAAWQDQTSGKFTLQMIEGEHFFINHKKPEILKAISEQLVQTLTI